MRATVTTPLRCAPRKHRWRPTGLVRTYRSAGKRLNTPGGGWLRRTMGHFRLYYCARCGVTDLRREEQ